MARAGVAERGRRRAPDGTPAALDCDPAAEAAATSPPATR